MEFIVVRARNRRDDASRKRQVTLSLHKSLRDTMDPFNDSRFQSLYRLTPDMARSLIQEIRAYFPGTHTSSAIPVEIKVLAALHFYGQGSYQKADGRDAAISLSQASVSRAISQTTIAINSFVVLRKWIKFPLDGEEKRNIIYKNYRKFGVPGVLGYVDGTHILIRKPSLHKELYVNRKGVHSLNVQVICDSELQILNVLAKYPGSTHDAFVWRASAARDKMIQLADTDASCWLLGDSGYPLEPWLLTPILNADPNTPESRYTRLHIKSRNCIERCFGILKARFRCLHKHRVLEYLPSKAGCIVNACAVLHNMCIKANLEVPDDVDFDMDQSQDPLEMFTDSSPQEGEFYNQGVRARANLINRLT